MEAIGVAASIIGIIAAAVKVSEVLGPLVSTLKDTAKAATTIYVEVNTTKIILSALQNLLDDFGNVPRKRWELIQLSQLIATLTDGALIFSELEPLVLQLSTSVEKWSTKIKWLRKKDELEKLANRLQHFKSSINVMLDIIQCGSDLEAARNHTKLLVLTMNLLNSNRTIASRLSLLERSLQPNTGNSYGPFRDRFSTATTSSQIPSLGFERKLESTWVYRKARRSTADISFRTSMALSYAWSALSDVSLSDISNISVVALPISSSDLTNGHHYPSSASSSQRHAQAPTISQPTTGVPTSTISTVKDYQLGASKLITNSRRERHRDAKVLKISNPTLIHSTTLESWTAGWNHLNQIQATGMPSGVSTLGQSSQPDLAAERVLKPLPDLPKQNTYGAVSLVSDFKEHEYMGYAQRRPKSWKSDEMLLYAQEENRARSDSLIPLTSEVKSKDLEKHPPLYHLPFKTKALYTPKNSKSSTIEVSTPSLDLRRSPPLAVLHSTQSLSKFVQDYPEKNLSVINPVTGNISFLESARMSAGSGSTNRSSSARPSLPVSLNLNTRQSKATLELEPDQHCDITTPNKYRDTRLIEIIEAQKDGLVSIANPRFGSLMTSKWLSFGRVLFSPVHFELKNPNEDRVLVVDGLGKDWSYHCALTYPEATVYNLVPRVTLSAMSNTNAPQPQTLRNHQNISHESLANMFPFPKGFFAAVIFRFPSAMSSSVHRLVISECKRVLQPGGHLELTVLDINLVNMGNIAQKAVQDLKVKIQSADKQVSLRNISDEIMTSLSRKGFIECKRCLVGLPVAGKLPGSDETDTPEDAASPVDQASAQTVKQPEPEVSFTDLLNEQPFTGLTNNGIDEMVARVGRWWYSRCYESLVPSEAGELSATPDELSIWRDESLIEECKMRGTSFRLLIGHAQKPEVGSKHTVSV